MGGQLVRCESVTQVGSPRDTGVLAWAVSASIVMGWVRRLRRVCGLSRLSGCPSLLVVFAFLLSLVAVRVVSEQGGQAQCIPALGEPQCRRCLH